ncbi:hypothetical protein MCOR02_002115 [Pyricularia oryzae]|nr:hypothetical protein MCOR02_002115 [Pyricularia oryzae]KAI6261012.1 hypothetical protein MCOR19_002669 [Pyricularia oryzae]KAI6399045.1 hypothetical protein MCOR23_005463 [Pyricularia oryzae]KAI6403326.1 hypothetical protein MCOR24_008194 [Pyricularia oryzae]KAI6433544.1 hypothetical protein MCOR21_002746 [Pyricularia oryzae]
MSLAARTTWPRDEGSKEDLVGSVDGHPSAKSGFWSWKGFIEMIKASNRVVQYIVSKVCGETRRLGIAQLPRYQGKVPWTLNGPLESAIQVMPNMWYDADAVMEPYFRPPATLGSEPSWHSLALEPLMTPPFHTVTVRPYCIADWEELLFMRKYTGAMRSGRYGEHAWADEDDYYDDHMLVERCGGQRPRSRDAKLQVKAAGAFVTIHDYVSQVHPWLMGMRERLLEALGHLDRRSAPWAPDTKLVVKDMHLLMIIRGKGFADCRRKPFVRPPGWVPLTPEEHQRQSTERIIVISKARMLAREAAAAAAAEQAAEGVNLGVK